MNAKWKIDDVDMERLDETVYINESKQQEFDLYSRQKESIKNVADTDNDVREINFKVAAIENFIKKYPDTRLAEVEVEHGC